MLKTVEHSQSVLMAAIIVSAVVVPTQRNSSEQKKTIRRSRRTNILMYLILLTPCVMNSHQMSIRSSNSCYMQLLRRSCFHSKAVVIGVV
jgi:hypothetical protein